MFNRDKDTLAMYRFSRMADSILNYKDSGRYAEGSWGYTGTLTITFLIRYLLYKFE